MVITVPRQKWTPESATDEQKRLIDEAIVKFRQRQQLEREGYAVIRAAQIAGVPLEYVVERVKAETEVKISPATAYRHMPADGADDASK
jgi:hypothetical protein